MHKGVIAYVVFGLLLMTIFIFWYLHWGSNSNQGVTKIVRPPSTNTTTIVKKNTTSSTNTTSISNTTPTNTTTSTLGSCLSSNATVPIYNGNFSLGSYNGWNTTGYGFGNSPLNITWADQNLCYYNNSWLNYEGDFFATTFHCGLEVQQGNLTSNPFKVVLPYLNFKIISPYDSQIYVEIIKNNKPIVITHYNTYNAQGNIYQTSQFENASIPIVMFMCQNVSIRVVADSVGTLVNRLDYIAVGDFYQSSIPEETPGIVVNQTVI
ncbi:MAG: hypothetical protein ACP5RT_00160 [Candidatus Micrarchaeia archaeon]